MYENAVAVISSYLICEGVILFGWDENTARHKKDALYFITRITNSPVIILVNSRASNMFFNVCNIWRLTLHKKHHLGVSAEIC